MKTIKKELPTGIITTQKDKGGIISVEATNYDDRFDFPTAGSEMVNEFFTYLGSIFKPN